jgi:hypothetical protein
MSSPARRVAEALEHARVSTTAAARVPGVRRAGEQVTSAQHVAALADLTEAITTIRGITADLAATVQTCRDTVRAYYLLGQNPAGGDWPGPLQAAASDVDRALTRLCQHLDKPTPASSGHAALSVLHGCVRDVHRAATRTAA